MELLFEKKNKNNSEIKFLFVKQIWDLDYVGIHKV